MKKLLLATAATALVAGAASADEVKLGVILGFTGPIESLTPDMAAGAEMAMAEVSASGNLLGGMTVTPIRKDSTCVDAAAATAAAEELIAEGVAGIFGADCSGVTGAILQNVAVPNGMVMVSPSATSPGLSTVEDNGLFFRTAPSDARQGVVMAELLKEQGVGSVALTYINSDYGKGLADSFQAAYEGMGGTVTISAAHDVGKGDYSAEVAALSSAGGERLVVAGYVDQGGGDIVRASIDAGAFDLFHFPDGMIGDALPATFGADIDGSYGQAPGSDNPGYQTFVSLAEGFNGEGTYASESYDAAALILLAMQAAGSTDPNVYKEYVESVANAPGEPIMPGELGKALEILAAGGDVDLIGATGVELVNGGEAAGSYRVVTFEGGEMVTAEYR
ncbi:MULTISPECIES: ABC transporter substrate-binding protein [unclassified Marivivens]|jgi:branched-chain amino acid transport system substrate-binding protein|uniref:ABC transporter substrate-binding protein n=1 Tax=unclassified Marivivens TaxID=2622455 RepID=UPI00080137D8|nr:MULTISPECIES: ABC transporter substrate-binding protein [unclassified Marivivens]MCL7405791.1 ABC transporter substrate-binding protein [Marivivens geojensis]OBR39439.1 branched-chain amino acid ABC transporter substrate-binding protein [Donghicola sp. JL3646]APO86708.1 branched-chain amino acid ABC transporter substrate-binding protein [Marivivens sp. JLT3646]NBX09992.1 branched-chain amino acid ABC transporter substrate-binding protein [Marivivens sp.]NVJ95838.1 ABC transporter substrate-